MKITDKTALKAAETIREYCRSKPNSCEGCVFHTEIERIGAYRFCLVETIIDTFIEENTPDNVNSGLWYLGKSLELLADADIAVFAKGWREARGCQIEFKCAKEYGISYICED